MFSGQIVKLWRELRRLRRSGVSRQVFPLFGFQRPRHPSGTRTGEIVPSSCGMALHERTTTGGTLLTGGIAAARSAD
ncbi:MAG: hypothetical protein JNK51_02045 [Blastocatellia bacterium]|nr:hypothetical protein [Blastocatellia bacterium]HBE82901.1 hypothetical protein [Blastocatellia bacterium]HRJ87927.1 hypothetical protein [Pyrinomonadaceae bacterium]HRK51854.1 hypothetical protein [Pyrinomonadaceae bacterium]